MIFPHAVYFFGFAAGLIDAVVGGGGLIQVPALFNAFPAATPVSLLGTNKIAGTCGTAFAARSYIRKVAIPWRTVIPVALSAFLMSFLGALSTSFVPTTVIRPLILVLVVAMAIYTFKKKDFGTVVRTGHQPDRLLLSILVGGAIGFYDGLFGPGTGTFLIFLFIKYFSLDFIQAAASSKVVNAITNMAALLFFIPAGHILYRVAIPLAICNMAGGFVGSKLALRHGVKFVRGLFLILLMVLVLKMVYEIVK
jgi:uncharacterized membrane protein YfcA